MNVYIPSLIIQHGILLCLMMGLLIESTLFINAEMWLNDYPGDIQKKFGKMGAGAAFQQKIAGFFFMLILTGIIILTIYRLNTLCIGRYKFLIYSGTLFGILEIFNIFDLFVLDFLIFVKIRPSYIVLEGTDGLEGYKNYGFHFNGFLKGTLLWAVLSIIIGGLACIF